MPRQNHVRMAFITFLGLVAAAVCSPAAEERDKLFTPPPYAKARRESARMAYEGAMQHGQQASDSVMPDVNYLHQWSVWWMQAEKDLGATKAEQIAAAQAHLKRMQSCKEEADVEFSNGMMSRLNATAAEFHRLEALDWVAEARGEGN